jgi:hypothetical protein
MGGGSRDGIQQRELFGFHAGEPSGRHGVTISATPAAVGLSLCFPTPSLPCAARSAGVLLD